MSTRRDTLKFQQLVSNPSVALLIHDFPTATQGEAAAALGSCSYSVTLNGLVSACKEGSEEERHYRSLHLLKNPDYRQFIDKKGQAVIVVRVERARLCDIQDKVTHWDIYGRAGSVAMS